MVMSNIDNVDSMPAPHPASYLALNWLCTLFEQCPDLVGVIKHSCDSNAIEGNELAAVCGETLRRLMNNEPVGDRDVLGLAWVVNSFFCG